MSDIIETRWTIDSIRHANRIRGKFFFEPGAMRFFRSRIGRTVYQGPGGVYFVTSEQFVPSYGPPDARCYTVRRFYPATGDVDTVKDTWQKFTSAASAGRFARKLASANPSEG